MLDLRRHGTGIAVPRIGLRVRVADADEMNPEMAKFLHQFGVRTFVISPAIREHAIDRSLEKSRHRPPVGGPVLGSVSSAPK